MLVRSRLVLGLAALAVGGLLVNPRPSSALTLVPPSMEFSVQPGEKVESKIKLFNEEQNPISVFTSVSNFTAKGENGDPDFDFAEDLVGLADWIDVGAGPFTLQPGDRIEIPFSINVPANAEPGGHYASIFFGTDPSIRAEDGGQVSIRSLIGSLIILRVAGDVREQAAIESFVPSDNRMSFSRLPVSLELRIENQGNVHIRPQGKIVIKNLFGGETTQLTINEANGAVLPDSVRRFESIWSKDASSSKAGNFFAELGAEWRNFGLGPYTATASVTYGQSGLTLTANTKFSVWPWRILTIGTLLIIGVILGLVFGIRRYNRAIINRAQHQQPPKTGAMK